MSFAMFVTASHVVAAAAFLTAGFLVLRGGRRSAYGTARASFGAWWAMLGAVEALRAIQHMLAGVELPGLHHALVSARLVALLFAAAFLARYVVTIYRPSAASWTLPALAYLPVGAVLLHVLLTSPLDSSAAGVAHYLVTTFPALARLIFVAAVVAPALALSIAYASLRRQILAPQQRGRHAAIAVALLTWCAAFLAALAGWAAAAHVLAVFSASSALLGTVSIGRPNDAPAEEMARA